MKRHEALADLSRDHHDALVQARAIRLALETAGDTNALAGVARAFLDFHEEELAPHMREEEEVLLPLFGASTELDREPAVAKLVADHAWLRETAHALAGNLPQRGDPRPALEALWPRLQEHVRFEERVLFPRIEEVLGDEGLDALAARSLAFRTATRGGARIGPRDACRPQVVHPKEDKARRDVTA